jgi:hypothetical protein
VSTARLWRAADGTGALDEVQPNGDTTLVVRSLGYVRPGSVACELRDTGNGFIARFPAHGSCDQDKYVCLGYDEARNLVLALTPSSKVLGFA